MSVYRALRALFVASRARVAPLGCLQAGRATRLVSASLALACLVSAAPALAAPPQPASVPAPIEVKVVVVTMFEIGADTGDTPVNFSSGTSARS